jgi:hypothetical protein
LTRRDIAYGLVIVWAYVGIAVRFPEAPLVSVVAWVGAALAAVQLVAIVARIGPWQRSQARGLA